MKTIIVTDIWPPITYQAKFWFSSYGPKCCWPIKLQGSLKCNASRKKWNNKIFNKLILSFWVCPARHAQSTQNRKFAYLCNISRKTWGMKLLFCLQINTKVFYKVLVSFWVCVSRLAQSTQNNKFAISLQYLKENRKNEVGFLLVDKHQRFLQIDPITLGVARHTQITQNNKFAFSLQYLKKKVSDEVDLWYAYKHESFLQIDTIIFDGDGQAFPKSPK